MEPGIATFESLGFRPVTRLVCTNGKGRDCSLGTIYRHDGFLLVSTRGMPSRKMITAVALGLPVS
ncbi:MAG: hypothetical protein FJW88_12765 [Actinobacteria bacterium]|nr:hypothetical protein [Actinomycetota bacterium]